MAESYRVVFYRYQSSC